MDLHSLFSALERAGVTTLGQAKSVLMTAGVNPMAIGCNHVELDKTVATLKPAAVSAVGAGAAAAAEKAAPGTDQFDELVLEQLAKNVAALVLEKLGPAIDHAMEGVEDRLHAKLEEHMSPVHETLTTIANQASSPAPAAPPAAAPQT